ncbi:hypothetical protein [Bifidobacterium leontopitheci]|uniref:Uncharacterized protein n=1 Tax=Bifidobacterium leontopitheci TaxID=2650774 RepID=A0A6I1GRC4_9BIFI|nr:hypothetical protein [Bifidobacterium leontopitheci]KAB7790688.1 hypothetical protein F7D09_0794 [Bifidobacterium leontopitheci]
MSFSSLIWNLSHQGMMDINVGDGACGSFVTGAFAGNPRLWGRGRTTIRWRGGGRTGPYHAVGADLWITARDGYSYVGLVPDDRKHTLTAFDLMQGRTVADGRPYLGVKAKVPDRALALYCDAAGDAVFADGHVIPGAFRGTVWQRDALASRDGRGSTPGLYRLRPDSAATFERNGMERAQGMVLAVNGDVFRASHGLLGAAAIILATMPVVAFIMMGEYGPAGVADWLMLLWSLAALCVIAAYWARRSATLLRRGCASSPMLGCPGADAVLRVARRRSAATLVALVLAVLLAVASLWFVTDLTGGAQVYEATYEGPDYASLYEDYRISFGSDTPYPTVRFRLDGGGEVDVRTGPDEFFADLGKEARTGDRYWVYVYPHSRIVQRVARIE